MIVSGIVAGRRRARRARERGFTLIELMVSLLLFSFAIAGVLSVAVTMARGFREQKQVVMTEGAARAVMEFIGDAVRGATPGVLSGRIENYHTCVAGPFALVDNDDAPDELTIAFAYGSVATSSTSAFARGDSQLDIVDATQFAAGDWILITDHATGHLLKVGGVASGRLTIETAPTCSGVVAFPTGDVYPRGALVVRVLQARFFVDDLDGIPTLWMDPDDTGAAEAEPLAEGVEDFQVELGIDPASDGVAEVGTAGNDDEWTGNHASDNALVYPSTLDVRAVRLSLVTRGTGEVTGIASFYRPAAANRAAATTPDRYRRRVLSSTIEIRNLGGSP